MDQNNLTVKIVELNNEYKQLLDTDWWLMSIIMTIELTALPLIFVLVFAILEFKNKLYTNDLVVDKNLIKVNKTNARNTTVFPQPSPETSKQMSKCWIVKDPIFNKKGYSGLAQSLRLNEN